MSARARGLARCASLCGIAAGVVSLVWRVLGTLEGTPLWLSVPLLAVEFGGLLAAALLVWAMWPSVGAHARRSDPDTTRVASVDACAVVRVRDQRLDAVRATVLATRPLMPVIVVDLHRAHPRADLARLAHDLVVTHLVADGDDPDGLVTAARHSDADALAVVDPGDIPHPDILAMLGPAFADPLVGAVQGRVITAPGESGETGPADRHELDLDRDALLPGLGARGAAVVTGTGALVRRAVLAEMEHPPIVRDAAPAVVHAHLSTTLLRAGWRIEAPGGTPVVAAGPLIAPRYVEHARASEASAARHLFGAALSLRAHLRLRVRLALAAASTRALAGLRRSVFVSVLVASLLAGRLPMHATWRGVVGLWLPSFILTSVGLWALSAGTLRPGDRLRWSMRMLGASWRGVLLPTGPGRPDRAPVGEMLGVGHGGMSAVAVMALSTAICLRALSDRITHTLSAMPLDQLVPLLGVVLWTLAGGLDALRLLAGRSRHRRAGRVASSLPGTLADRPALVVDLTPLGAGVMAASDVHVEVGDHERLEVVIPTASGCVSASVPAVVRNVREDFSGDQHVGVEFGEVDPFVADALAEYCIVQPALDALGRPATNELEVGRASVVEPSVPSGPGDRRVALRAAALVAVVGAMACTVPRSAEASEVVPTVSGRVVASGVLPAGAFVTSVCATAAGADGALGTSDDVFTPATWSPVVADGTVIVPLEGDACWWSVTPPAGWVLGDAAGDPVDDPQVARVIAGDDLGIIRLVPGASDPITAPGITASAAVSAGVAVSTAAAGDREPLAGVAVAIVDRSGAVRGVSTTGGDGVAAFSVVPGRYHLAVSSLPTGVRTADPLGRGLPFVVVPQSTPGTAPQQVWLDARRGPVPPTITGETPERLLPDPGPHRAVGSRPAAPSPLAALVVVLLAGLIGASVLVGSIETVSRSRPTSP